MIRLTIRLTSPKNKFLRASASLCPKKVILVVRSALATLDPSRIDVNLYVNRRQSNRQSNRQFIENFISIFYVPMESHGMLWICAVAGAWP